MEPATAAAATEPASTPPPSAGSSARPVSTASARPKSAGVGVRKPLRAAPSGDARSDDARPAAPRLAVYAKPRPPSASSALAARRPHPQCVPVPSPADAPGIASQVLREEIETQRKVTRRAQRELNALRVQHEAKRHEIALLQRHLRAFDVAALPGARATASAADAVSPLEQLKRETKRLDAYAKTLRAMLDRLARHLQYLRANAELLEAQRVAAAREAALCQDKVAQDKSLCAELETRRAQLVRDRAAHALHAQQLLASLRSELASRSRVSQQRQDADRRREEMLRLVESRPLGASHTADGSAPAASFQPPPLQKRQSHGRRDSFRMLMNESMHFFGASQPSSRAGSVDAASSDATRIASSAAMAVAESSRRLQALRVHTSTAAVESLAAVLHRETFFQVYETQYERILEQTRESDLAIVLERFRGYHETRARLEQIERDLAAEDAALDVLRRARTLQLQQLRLSGIAEVEKRKKIRDFLEQQYLVKSAARAQAKEAFVCQLKTFSYVQQGVLNITELLKCLDEKFSPPVLSAVSALATATAAATVAATSTAVVNGPMVHRSVLTPAATAEIDWLQSLLYSCRSVVRATASLSTLGDFTHEQIARLGELDPMLGLAAGAWAIERLKHSIPGGNVVWKAGPNGQSIEDASETDDEDEAEAASDDEDDDSDEEVEDRERIKHSEAETLAQAELLIRTLDSRQQIAQQEQSMQRMRRAFGLGEVSEESDVGNQEPPRGLDPAAKLAAVHAFFKEKRLREKHEQQERREMIAALGGFAQLSDGPKRRGSTVTPSQAAGASGAVAMASIMAEMRSAGHRSSISGPRPVTPTSPFTTGTKAPIQRKRSNAVSFTLSQPMNSQQGGQLVKAGATVKPPTRPVTPATGTATPLHRRGSNGTIGASASTSVAGAHHQQLAVKHHPDSTQSKPR